MKLLVTGGAGLVGSHVAEYYAKKGDEVIVLDNLMRSGLFGYNKESVECNWNYLTQFKNIKRMKSAELYDLDIKMFSDDRYAKIRRWRNPSISDKVENGAKRW